MQIKLNLAESPRSSSNINKNQSNNNNRGQQPHHHPQNYLYNSSILNPHNRQYSSIDQQQSQLMAAQRGDLSSKEKLNQRFHNITNIQPGGGTVVGGEYQDPSNSSSIVLNNANPYQQTANNFSSPKGNNLIKPVPTKLDPNATLGGQPRYKNDPINVDLGGSASKNPNTTMNRPSIYSNSSLEKSQTQIPGAGGIATSNSKIHAAQMQIRLAAAAQEDS